MPKRSAIEPPDIRQWLPRLQLHWREANGRYRCRLSGTGIVTAAGVDSTGQYLDEIVAPAAYASRKAVFDRVLETGRPARYRSRLTVAGKEWKAYRRILLPLRYRAPTPDMVLSCVAFETAPVQPGSSDDGGLIEMHEASADDLA